MSWKNYGDHPIIVAIAVFGTLITIGQAIHGASSPQKSTQEPDTPSISNSNGDVEVNTHSSRQSTQGDSSPNITNSNGTVQVNLEGSETYKPSQTIPLKQGMEYKKARELLISHGWQAKLPTLRDYNAFAKDSTMKRLASQGFKEVVLCSGTGAGFCRFEFKNAEGQLLAVTTVNNPPRVR
ncbi:hypothetical protein H6F89_24250 [Cyanobacteria bacterium FACHB-63]|nr:hypothetical protein [Cyanobacteria bacterium FACHB-63]